MSLNIVIGTHGKFGESLVESASMIVGSLDSVYTVSLLPEYSFEEYMEEAVRVMDSLEGPTITFVDLFGGTPSNVFTVLSKKYNNAVVTGVNLPVLIDTYLSNQSKENVDLNEVVEQALSTLVESGKHTNKELN